MMVIRISEVMIQMSKNDRVTKSNRRKVQSSTTLNRKYVKRVVAEPELTEQSDQMMATDQAMQMGQMKQMQQAEQMEQVKQMEQMRQTEQVEPQMQAISAQTSPMISHFNSPAIAPAMQTMETIEMHEPHPMQSSVNAKMRKRSELHQAPQAAQLSAKELKDQAIQKALTSAEKIDNQEGKNMQSRKKKSKKSGVEMHFGFGRVMLALSCAVAAVFAIVYFVNLNMPDISLQVAAMQTGMDLSYPNYVPRDYSVSSITSEENKITIEFNNSASGNSFSLTEEKSSWDTNALLSNFVKEEYGENYTIIREQGLTLYVSGSNATWVNGGVVYKITATNGTLTNKQIRSIAVSL